MTTSPKQTNPVTKLARQRLSVLQLAEELGNVAEACRRRGMDRTSFYAWKKRFQSRGFAGLHDLPPIHKTHPQTTPKAVVDTLLALVLKHPSYGCERLQSLLLADGASLSHATVQNLLNKHELGTRYQRWLALEKHKQTLAGFDQLAPEQVAFLESVNPTFRERHVESSSPGELLCQDTFFVGHLKGIGKVYLHSLVDTYSSLAFGFLFTSKQATAPVALLHNYVLPFYQQHQVPVQSILTDNGSEFVGDANAHPYELYLRLNDIEHRKTKIKSPQTNGFVERWHRTVLDEFFRLKLSEKFYTKLDELQADLDTWLMHYNTERPHLGYRNEGRMPMQTFEMMKEKAQGADDNGKMIFRLQGEKV